MSRRASVDSIQEAIDKFVHGIPTLERKQYDRIYALLKDLSLDADGKINPTIENLKIVNRVKNQLDSVVNSDEYIGKVADLKDAISKVSDVQTAYLTTAFAAFEPSALVPHLEKMANENVVSSLTDAGVNENVVNAAADIVEQHVRDGSSFTTLVDELKDKIVTSPEIDSKLVSYSKQTINDTLSGFSRNYHKLITADLGLQWFVYVGALVDSSRPFCKAMVAKHYIHESEFGAMLRNNSHEGLMAGTNVSNLIDRCGGWNCSHQLVPVPSSSVPSSLRRKFEPDVTADETELTDARPKRK
jgi:hypothetical protein